MQPWLNTTMRETVKPRQTEVLPRAPARAPQPRFSTRGGRYVPSCALPSPARSESAGARKRKEKQWRRTGRSAAPRGMLGAGRGVLFGISLSEVRFSITSKLWISLLQEPADKQKFLARQVKLVFTRYSVHGQGFEVFQHHREIHGFNWTQGIRSSLQKMNGTLFLKKKSNDQKYHQQFYNKNVDDISLEVALGFIIYVPYA
ncbi:uncharacterized protein LOC125692373 [Lagopus muta]|uniref:uncharacterized protein LOC125692373 n=1 Tax=Lagopus muta TaxID=64668 RepID=UPI00209E8A9A|nr:uncharacterized protein LOC125692373 [Lagopus muta]XP_048798750.1 uncharacterized protein LOC125692373 [Lagopus muta]